MGVGEDARNKHGFSQQMGTRSHRTEARVFRETFKLFEDESRSLHELHLESDAAMKAGSLLFYYNGFSIPLSAKLNLSRGIRVKLFLGILTHPKPPWQQQFEFGPSSETE
jgi:hypothetical protein